MDRSSLNVIWDLPTRVFHWLFVVTFAVSFLSHDDNRFLYLHVFSGYVFFGLLVFRLLWGVIGSHYARFHTFSHNWKSVSEYLLSMLNGNAMRHIGHNPIGGWAIFLMLILGFCLSIAGMLTLAGEEGHGPLREFISYRVGIISDEVHEFTAWIMLGIVAIHVAGVIIESIIHKDNLIWAMITGRKETHAGAPKVRGHHLLGLLIIALICTSALAYFRGYLEETADNLYQPFVGPVLPDNALWREECGDCHFAFHPTLLPERSWRRVFAEQHEHFGDDLDLDDETINELLVFHIKYSSESDLTEPARKILFYMEKNENPIRITKTRYWLDKHKDIAPAYWKHKNVLSKANCKACHLDAEQGTYEDSDMRLPNINE